LTERSKQAGDSPLGAASWFAVASQNRRVHLLRIGVPQLRAPLCSQRCQVLFTISNDGWFGKTAARWQHLEIVRMRAAENRRWILRAANDGITAPSTPPAASGPRCRCLPR